MSDATRSEDADDEYDPLAVFQSMAAGPSSQELYGQLADLRAIGAVHVDAPLDPGGEDGTSKVPPWGPEPRFTTVSFEAAHAVLGNPDMSSSGYYERVSSVF